MTFKMRSDWVEVSKRENKHFRPRKNICKGPEVESLRTEKKDGARQVGSKRKQVKNIM